MVHSRAIAISLFLNSAEYEYSRREGLYNFEVGYLIELE